MWTAIENATRLVAPNGRFFISVYNDQGFASKIRLWIKKLCVVTPSYLRWLNIFSCFARLRIPWLIAERLIDIARGLYTEEPFGVDLAQSVYALDATTIDLCLSVFPWTPFRSTRAAVKLHTLLDLCGNIPVLFISSMARCTMSMCSTCSCRKPVPTT